MGGSSFDPTKDIPDLTGKVILITGGTAGLGAGTVVHLAQHNPAHIIFTGRNAKSASSTLAQCQAVAPSTLVTFLPCDLADLSSVRAAADKVLAMNNLPRIHILICNAGIMARLPGLSPDGYEIQFATNHLGHALLIHKLIPRIRGEGEAGGGRIVIVTSVGWRGARGIAFDRLRTTQEMPFLGHWLRYGQSKLANMIYARELAARYPDILSLSVHPGVVSTGFVTDLGFADKALVHVTNIGRILTPDQGTHNLLWAAVAEENSIKPGAFYEPVGVLSKMSSSASKDPELGGRLWEWTEGELARWL